MEDAITLLKAIKDRYKAQGKLRQAHTTHNNIQALQAHVRKQKAQKEVPTQTQDAQFPALCTDRDETDDQGSDTQHTNSVS